MHFSSCRAAASIQPASPIIRARHSAKGNKHVKKWTKDGLMKLSDAELSSLHENVQSTAQRKCTKFTEEAIALLPLIEGEQKRRAASHAPEVGKVRRRPRTERARIERQYADAIVCLIKSLSERFDLSPEAAIRRSLEFPGFVPRSPLDRYGDALVGGALTTRFEEHHRAHFARAGHMRAPVGLQVEPHNVDGAHFADALG